MIGIFSSLFKQRKPRPFSYKPSYYNEEQEAREKRNRRIKSEIELEEQQGALRKTLHEKWRKNQKHTLNRQSNMRVLIIAALLGLICYLVLR